MKGLPRYLDSLAFFYLVGLCDTIVNVISIEAQLPTADQLLSIKVAELNRFVQTVEENSRNCSALEGCSDSSADCSRLTCFEYGKQDDSNYKCVEVLNNSQACERTTCNERNFDYSRAFVRYVPGMNVNSPILSRTVCTHRTLDVQFKNSTMNDSSHFFRAFFGSVDGTTRIYPGADEDDCNSNSTFDPRIRPWYIRSTSVPKVVTILIESGTSMHEPSGIPNGNVIYFDKAITMVLKFLGTLQDGIDVVNIMRFDSSGTLPVVNATKSANLTEQQKIFNDSLTGINYSVNSDPNATHISNAINTSIVSQVNPNLFESKPLKVVIVLTKGSSFNNLSDLDIPANSGVNVFLYSFGSDRQPACNPAIRAFSENIPDGIIDNPLYALQSYFSFLAQVHKNFCYDSLEAIDYTTIPYPDYSGVDNNTLTLSKAAFGQNGELLGVVAIDIFQNKFAKQYKPQNINFQDIVDAAKIRHENLPEPNNFNTSKDLNTSVCFQAFNSTESCSGHDNNVSGFLCQMPDSKKGDRNIGCCANCTNTTAINPTASIGNATPTGPEVAKILGGVAGGIVGLLVIAAIGFFTWPCIARRVEEERALAESPEFTFPGPENGEPVITPETLGHT